MTTDHKPAGKRVSVRAFARLAACDEKQVRRAIHMGRIVAGPDGMLDATQIDGGWRRANRRARPGSRGYVVPCSCSATPPLDEAARAFVACLDQSGFDRFLADMMSGKLASIGEAERIKVNAQALKYLLAARAEARRLIGLVRPT